MIPFDTAQRNSTVFGMLLIVLIQLQNEEIVKTIVLAGIGGVSSYLFTIVLKQLMEYFRKKMK